MKQIACLILLVLTACTGGSIMTMNSFSEIPLGSTSEEVVSSCGKPYSIQKKNDGTVEYEYLERITAGARLLEERIYVLVIKDGKVASKRIKQSSPAPFYQDSYDMQTTQLNDSPPPDSD